MGKLSMSLALVALLAVAGTSYAARPIDISSDADSIKPMNALEEQVVSDSSRELLAMHYPPPPPLSETQGNEGRPLISQSIGLSFNSSEHASNFSSAVGTIRCSNADNQCDADASRKLLNMHGPAEEFAEAYLNDLMDATEGTDAVAEDGVVTVTATDDEITMTSTLYFPDGTSEGDLGTAKTALESNDVSNLSDEFDAVKTTYGVNEDFDAFTTAAQGSFTVESGAQGLQASLLMGVAVVLFGFLLA